MVSDGRTFFVTGANSGIGRALVEALAGGARAGTIVLATRSAERTRPVLDELQRRNSAGAHIRWIHLDVADLSSVRRAVDEFLSMGLRLDVLVNNAGVAGTHAVSPDGYDLTYATNHIGPFLLTELLLPALRESSQGRVVNVASGAHKIIKRMDWSGLERRASPKESRFKEYAFTKLMNILHAKELARRVAGSRVTTYALHPGGVRSNIWRAIPQPLRWFIKLFCVSNEEGAKTPLYCATAPELATVSGKYYDKSREAKPSALAEDPALARELWERTTAIVNG